MLLDRRGQELVVVANAEEKVIHTEDAIENLYGRTEVGKREEALGKPVISSVKKQAAHPYCQIVKYCPGIAAAKHLMELSIRKIDNEYSFS